MPLPEHSPVLPLRYNDTYDQNVRCYGKPPKGYRWLKVGDKTSSKTLLVTPLRFDDYPYGKTVKSHQWPAIEPIAKPVAPTPLAQIKTLLLANPKIAADVMRECIRVIADRN